MHKTDWRINRTKKNYFLLTLFTNLSQAFPKHKGQATNKNMCMKSIFFLMPVFGKKLFFKVFQFTSGSTNDVFSIILFQKFNTFCADHTTIHRPDTISSAITTFHCSNILTVVESLRLPSKTSYPKGMPYLVTTRAMHTCLQSGRWVF